MNPTINALKAALEGEPGDWGSRLALIEAYLQEGQQDEAAAVAAAAVEIPADLPSLEAAARGLALVESPRAEEFTQALAAAEAAPAQAQATAAPAIPPPTIVTVDDQLDETVDEVEEPPQVPVPDSAIEESEDPVAITNITSLADRKGTAEPPVLLAIDESEVVEEVGEDDVLGPHPETDLRHHLEESEALHRKDLRRNTFHSLLVTIMIHVVIFFALGMIVISVVRDEPPQIVAVAIPSPTVDTEITKKVIQPTEVANTETASMMPDIVSAFATSDVSVPSVENVPIVNQAVFGHAFTPAINFGPTGELGQPAIFGEVIEGKTLGVILDVSGSMAEFLPKVVREIDRNFDKASIIFVNNAMMRSGTESTTEIRPILTDDVIPFRKDGTTNVRTPYWFLWHDLPRKSDQAAVDRLIKIFKERPNCYLAVGGNDRVTGAMDHLRSLGVDALYIFSDFEDFVDEDAAIENARKLSKAGIKTYIQPAQKETEFLEVVSRKIVKRTDGKQLPPLIAIRTEDLVEEPKPLLAEVMDPIPIVVEGVSYGTPREERFGKQFYDFHSPGAGQEIIEVFEHENFDLVLYGPEARAEIFLKDKGGYISRPVSFRWHSRKWFVNERGDLSWRRRKWLRNLEPPKLEGNEITWKMVIEDELEFEVWFVFKDNKFMATYAAELAPIQFENKGDYAGVHWYIPAMAVGGVDIYYSTD
ncbi:MAG: hypothetical protein ACC661_07070, partial [Verrucomicrobiales bacterium]